MIRQLLIDTGRFFQRTDFYALIGSFLSILGVVLPLVSEDSLYTFFPFRNAWQILLYIVSIVIIFFLAVIVAQILGHGLVNLGRSLKINVEVKEYLRTGEDPKHFSIKVINHEREDLTQCRATLVVAEQFYTPSTVLDIREKINPTNNLMPWGGGAIVEDVITIPGENGEKVINIARHTGAGRIVFTFFNWRSDEELANVKYHVVVKISGKLNGEPFKAITYEGCFRTENYISPLARVASGRITPEGELVEGRETVVGGTPETRFEFLPCQEQ